VSGRKGWPPGFPKAKVRTLPPKRVVPSRGDYQAQVGKVR
jgi:hypothetical protein